MQNTMSTNLRQGVVAIVVIAAVIFGFAIMRHRAKNTLTTAIFEFDSEHGYVVPIPQQQARFMGLPMFLAISSRFGVQGGPAIEDLNRASKALSILSQCLEMAEKRLAEYNKQGGITADEIQNPHVWIDSEEDDVSRWTFVIESSENDGYAWHIEFKDAEFHDIWAGS